MKLFAVLMIAGGIYYWYWQDQQDMQKFLQNAGCADPNMTRAKRILCLSHNLRDSAQEGKYQDTISPSVFVRAMMR